ncbi:hypothetical protein PI125_g14785 [Phytophthora idaei]|nr:hypothetical protein PI125_g14785 [Phytophthora idaei]
MSPRRSRTISTGSRRTSKLPRECGGVLRRVPTRQVTPAREGGASHPRGYWPSEPSSGAELYLEQLVAPRGLIGGHTSKGAYERTLVQRNQLFTENIEAARCVLLAPHRIALKEFTTRRKKPENRGGLNPVWGYPWVCPRELPVVGRRRLAVLEVGSFS